MGGSYHCSVNLQGMSARSCMRTECAGAMPLQQRLGAPPKRGGQDRQNDPASRGSLFTVVLHVDCDLSVSRPDETTKLHTQKAITCELSSRSSSPPTTVTSRPDRVHLQFCGSSHVLAAQLGYSCHYPPWRPVSDTNPRPDRSSPRRSQTLRLTQDLTKQLPSSSSPSLLATPYLP